MYSDYKKLSDEELVHRYAHKNEQIAIQFLYERYGHLIYGVCVKYLRNTESAKDATQQIFIKLLEDLKRFEIEKFKPWLFRVAKNHCLMQIRNSRFVKNNEFADVADMEFEEDWHQKIEEEHLLSTLEAAINDLNYEQRVCIELFYLQKMTYFQISQKMGYKPMQVKSHIQNGRRNLKIIMEKASEKMKL